jgi:hypothetical protein
LRGLPGKICVRRRLVAAKRLLRFQLRSFSAPSSYSTRKYRLGHPRLQAEGLTTEKGAPPWSHSRRSRSRLVACRSKTCSDVLEDSWRSIDIFNANPAEILLYSHTFVSCEGLCELSTRHLNMKQTSGIGQNANRNTSVLFFFQNKQEQKAHKTAQQAPERPSLSRSPLHTSPCVEQPHLILLM